MTPKEQLLEELLLERHNGGGWRPTNPPTPAKKTPRPRRKPELQWDDSEVTRRRRQRDLLDAVRHVPIKETEEEETA